MVTLHSLKIKTRCLQLRAHGTYFEKYSHVHLKMLRERHYCQKTDFEQKIMPKSPKIKVFFTLII